MGPELYCVLGTRKLLILGGSLWEEAGALLWDRNDPEARVIGGAQLHWSPEV